MQLARAAAAAGIAGLVSAALCLQNAGGSDLSASGGTWTALFFAHPGCRRRCCCCQSNPLHIVGTGGHEMQAALRRCPSAICPQVRPAPTVQQRAVAGIRSPHLRLGQVRTRQPLHARFASGLQIVHKNCCQSRLFSISAAACMFLLGISDWCLLTGRYGCRTGSDTA